MTRAPARRITPVSLAGFSNHARSQWRDKLVVRQGWLCKTNQNSDNKNSERFFFREPGRNDVPEQIPLPKEAREKYESLILDYQTRHESDVKKRRRPEQREGDDKPERDDRSRAVVVSA